MDWYAAVIIGLAGLALYVGGHHVSFYCRDRNRRELLAFAAICLSIAAYDIFSAGLYRADTCEAGAFWQTWQFTTLSIFGASLIWLSAELITHRWRIWDWILYGWLAVQMIAVLIAPDNWVWTAQPSIKRISTYWFTAVYRESQPGVLITTWSVWGIAALGYVLATVAAHSRRKHRSAPLLLLMGIVVVLAAVVNDMAVSTGLYSFFYTIEWAFLFFVLATTEFLAISHSRIRSALDKSHIQMSRMAAAVDSAAESITITDEEGKIQYVNPAFEKMTGYTQEECVGKTHSILKSGRHSSGFYRKMWSTISSGSIWKGTFINRKKDGSLFEEEGTISPVKDYLGRIINYVAVKRDVTHEKMLEQQVFRSQKMAAIGQFAHKVAHDFNNALAVIISSAQYIERRHRDSPDIPEPIKSITDAASSISKFNGELMAFAQPPSLNFRKTEPALIVRGVREILKHSLSGNITLDIDVREDAPEIFMDADQMEQALVHLALNAQDAMPQGGTLTVRMRQADPSDHDLLSKVCGISPDSPRTENCLIITVSDTGAGIKEKDLPRIFEPFFSTKGKEDARAGLGLAMVYRIVEWHKGYIQVESRVGEGTKFMIFLPPAGDNPGQPSIPQDTTAI
ncbi:MAG: PAS domain S-box protein [Kiritimatiellia bacterium]